MMATFMLMMIPRAAVCADRIRRCSTPRPSVVPPPSPVTRARRRAARSSCATSTFRYPGAEQPGAARHHRSRAGPARPPRSSAAPAPARPRWSTWSRGCSTPPRARCSSTASTSATSTPTLLWTRIGLVPQRPYLFSGTVASNLRYGKPDATDEELWEALEVAQAARLRRGDARAGSTRRSRRAAPTSPAASASGSRSPGPLVRRPEIYLFDDSFSALDLATDARLRAALRAGHRATRRCVIVAQRVSTIRDADQILVLEDGAVVGRGTHDELLDDLPDLPRDRRLPAHRGGGGMTDVARPAPRPRPEADRADRRRRRRRPGPRPDGRRHGRPEGDGLRPVGAAAARAGCVRERAQGARRRRCSAVVSVALTSVGPADPRHGDRPDLRRPDRRPAARRHHQGAGRRRACAHAARTSSPTWSPRWTSCPARASTSPPSATCCCSCSRSTSPRRCSAGCRATCSTTSCSAPCCRMRADVEDKVNRLPLSYFDKQPRGELLSRVTNDIDNVSQTLQQTMSQLLTSLLTVVGVLVDDVLDLAAAGAGRAGLGAALDARDPRRHEALAGHVRRSSGGVPAGSTPTSRRPSPATRWSRSSAARREVERDLRRGERRALRGVVRRAVRLRADHADR